MNLGSMNLSMNLSVNLSGLQAFNFLSFLGDITTVLCRVNAMGDRGARIRVNLF